MVRRSSSGDSLSLRDLADDFFSQPPQMKMKSSSNPSPSRRSNRLGSRGSDHSFSVEDLTSSRRSNNRLSRRESTGNLSSGRSNKLIRRGSTGQNIVDCSFTGDDLVAPPSSRSKSHGKSALPSHHGGAEDFSSSLHSFSALLRKSSMEAELRLSQKQNDVRLKSNGFFDMPSPPFPFSPNDVRSNNISSSNRTSSKSRLSLMNNRDGDDDIHVKSDESPRSTKSTYNPKPSRRWSSPADISHSHRAHEKGRSSRSNSLRSARDDKEHNPYVVAERQSPVRRGSSSSIWNTTLNQKGIVRSSSTSEDTKKSYPSTTHVKKYLQHYANALRLPAGFLASIIKAYKSTDSRLWLMDNTSSMKIRDSNRAKIDANLKHIKKDGVRSRWTELSQTVDFHVKMSARCFIPTKFWLVNDPGSSVGPQRFSVAWGNHDDVKTERTIALDMMKRIRLETDQNHLIRQLRKIEKRVREEAPRLIASNKVVSVVLCTQGRQTDEHGNEGSAVMKDCVDSLKALSKLPVKIVVRLCAHDEKATEFVSKIDGKVDSLVILGDYWKEAMKVNLHNPWLTYGLGIHRLRESCLTSDLLNDLGRRAFAADDICEFCKEFLIGEKEIELPRPHNSLDAFLRVINHLLEDEKSQWNPVKKKLTPWIDMEELEMQCRSCL